MKRLLLALLLFAFPRLASAQAASFDFQQVLWKYNLNSVSENFCALKPNVIPVADRVLTSGASTTLTAVSGTPFLDVSVGDTLFLTDSPAGGGESYTKTVVVRTSSTSVIVNNAISPDVAVNLTSGVMSFRKIACGTGENDGAFGVPYRSFSIVLSLDQIVVTNLINFKLYCRSSGSSRWIQQAPAVTPPATSATAYQPTAAWWVSIDASGLVRSECRVGSAIATADDGAGDLGTNSEQFSISVLGLK